MKIKNLRTTLKITCAEFDINEDYRLDLDRLASNALLKEEFDIRYDNEAAFKRLIANIDGIPCIIYSSGKIQINTTNFSEEVIKYNLEQFGNLIKKFTIKKIEG